MPNNGKSIKQRDFPDASWLADYKSVLAQANGPLLELGCGRGSDTGFLLAHGDVVAVDVRKDALVALKEQYSTAQTVVADLSAQWPFADNMFSFVLGSLSLHYFNEFTTRQCVSELRRVLAPLGTALLRFNSTNDVNYGAASKNEIEPHFYQVDDQAKRFFSEDDLLDYFSDWHIEHMEELEVDRYRKTKVVWELVCRPEIEH